MGERQEPVVAPPVPVNRSLYLIAAILRWLPMSPSQKPPQTPPLSGVLSSLASDPKLRGMVTHVGDQRLHMQGPDAAWPFAVGALARHRPVLLVTATGRQAEDLTAQLTAMLGDTVAMVPSWETLPHERLSPGVETVSQRRQALYRLAHGEVNVLVAPTRSVVQPVMAGLGEVEPVRLAEGVELDFSEVQQRLVEFGFTISDVV